MEHHLGATDKAGDDNVQDQVYSFDGSALGVDSYTFGSFDTFCSLQPDEQPVGFSTSDPTWSFENVSDSAFSGYFCC
jgi:hypothetical protein